MSVGGKGSKLLLRSPNFWVVSEVHLFCFVVLDDILFNWLGEFCELVELS